MKKEEENGEELIDLNLEDNANSNSKNNIQNKKAVNNNNKVFHFPQIIFIVLILFILIILIYFILKSNKNEIKRKDLIIFDFDKTISFNDVFEEQRFLLPSVKEQEEIMERMYYENWTLLMSSVYDRFYELNITISDINNFIDTIKYTNGMVELLQYLQKYKNKYSIVILSAGHYYQIIRMLQRINMTDLFDEIIAIPSYIENNKIIVTQTYEHHCDICNAGQCKTLEYNKLLDKFKKDKNIIFDKVYYICDGLNDYCLARNMGKNDSLLVRKNYTLYEGLYNKGMIKNISCKVEPWDDGFDVINFFTKELN
jgi:2,3-diketo-5-methylthio-1-phosphopentane phosphatase